MNFHTIEDVRLVLPQSALNVIFDECDKFDQHETGGRIIGTFKIDEGNLTLNVTGIIKSGSEAQRTQVSFFQDGKHQENIFRQIERNCPEVEHLGNWHTHHVNGLSKLSNGDIETYQRTVNHKNHNTPFFYALLVVAKNKTSNPNNRYSIKHYILRRNNERVYEIPPQLVEIVNMPLVWPLETAHNSEHSSHRILDNMQARPERVYDQDILRDFYPEVRHFASKKLGLYWRGDIELVDGSKLQIVLVEDSSSQIPKFSIVLRDPPDTLTVLEEHLSRQEFPSARAALIMAERSCNRILYESLYSNKNI